MAYLVDSDVFIQAKNWHYAFDVVPGFWDWLIEANANGVLASVEAVRSELRDGGDELAQWARARDDAFFLPPDELVVDSLPTVSDWAQNCGLYEPGAIAEFLAKADYYLVAHAHAHRGTVVTHEVAANTRKKIKIPNACAALNVGCMTPFECSAPRGSHLVKGT